MNIFRSHPIKSTHRKLTNSLSRPTIRSATFSKTKFPPLPVDITKLNWKLEGSPSSAAISKVWVKRRKESNTFGHQRQKWPEERKRIWISETERIRCRIINLDDPKDPCNAVTKQYLYKQLRENALTDTMKVVVKVMKRYFQVLRNEMSGVKL